MIRILAGENTYFIKQRLESLEDATRVDGEKIAVGELADLLSAQSLFSEKRTVVIDGLSANKIAWEWLADNLDRIIADYDLNLILIEIKPDGRSKIIKQAKKEGWLEEFKLPEKPHEAAKLLEVEAKKLGLKLAPNVAKMIVERVGVELWAGFLAFEKLSVLGDTITTEVVEKYIPPSLEVSAFKVSDDLFVGKSKEVAQAIDEMDRTSVNCYQFFGLIISQATNLLMIKLLGREQAGTQLKLHPFVVEKLASVARRLDLEQIRQIIDILSDTDLKLKTTGQHDWTLVKLGLLEIANLISE